MSDYSNLSLNLTTEGVYKPLLRLRLPYGENGALEVPEAELKQISLEATLARKQHDIEVDVEVELTELSSLVAKVESEDAFGRLFTAARIHNLSMLQRDLREAAKALLEAKGIVDVVGAERMYLVMIGLGERGYQHPFIFKKLVSRETGELFSSPKLCQVMEWSFCEPLPMDEFLAFDVWHRPSKTRVVVYIRPSDNERERLLELVGDYDLFDIPMDSVARYVVPAIGLKYVELVRKGRDDAARLLNLVEWNAGLH